MRHRRLAPGRHWAHGESDIEGAPERHEMITTSAAAEILDVSSRTVIRWIDRGQLRGGRPRDPRTGEPVPWSARWADARDAVRYAVAAGRGHLVPEQWRYLIPGSADAETPTAGD